MHRNWQFYVWSQKAKELGELPFSNSIWLCSDGISSKCIGVSNDRGCIHTDPEITFSLYSDESADSREVLGNKPLVIHRIAKETSEDKVFKTVN